MPVVLTEPKQAIALDRMSIARIEIQNNVCSGERWVMFYLILIKQIDSELRQYVDPQTGTEAALEVKVENGLHPLAPGQALSKCPLCGKWYHGVVNPVPPDGICTVEDCGGTLALYDGLTRLSETVSADGATHYEVNRDGSYAFLLNEDIPDPVTGVVRKILAGVQE